MNVRPFDVGRLSLAAGASETFPVIEIVPGQIVTRRRDERPSRVNGSIVADTERDLLKLVVVERHKATGNIGVGLVGGFRLRRGALATSVAHDSHNIVVVGVDDADIFAAVKEVEQNQGGLCVVAGGEVLASLPLPIAGLLSTEPWRRSPESWRSSSAWLGSLAAPSTRRSRCCPSLHCRSYRS